MHRVGDEVTILKHYDGDPYIVGFRRYAKVSRVVQPHNTPHYFVHLTSVVPPGQEFGPFPPSRLAAGWRDANGRWR